MNKKQHSFVLCLFSVVFLFCTAMVCAGQSFDAKEYIGEFGAKWNEYLRALGNVEGSYLYTDTRNGRQERQFTNSVVCAYPLFADVRARSVEVTGEKYRFALERSDSADGWTVENISADLPDREVVWRFPEHFALTASHVIDPDGYSIFNTIGVGLFGINSNPNLPYMVASEWIKIHEISPVEKDNENRLLMSFDYKQKNYSLKGKVFLTTDFFLVTDGEFHVESGLGIENVLVRIDYDNTTYKVPLPKNYYWKNSYNFFHNDPPAGVLVNERKFDLRETDPNSFKKFTLSHYGLPEPDFGERRSSPFRYILMSIGALMIAYALWRIYRERKKEIE